MRSGQLSGSALLAKGNSFLVRQPRRFNHPLCVLLLGRLH